jgi:hypothetical protein
MIKSEDLRLIIFSASQDNREKLAAMELFKDTHLVKLELLSNATTIDRALEYIRSKQRGEEKKHVSVDPVKSNEDISDSQITADTTNGKQRVF